MRDRNHFFFKRVIVSNVYIRFQVSLRSDICPPEGVAVASPTCDCELCVQITARTWGGLLGSCDDVCLQAGKMKIIPGGKDEKKLIHSRPAQASQE